MTRMSTDQEKAGVRLWLPIEILYRTGSVKPVAGDSGLFTGNVLGVSNDIW
jgi:hypothetical protein